MGMRLSGDYGKLSDRTVQLLIVVLLGVGLLANTWSLLELRDDQRADRRLIAELIEHEGEQADLIDAMLCHLESVKGEGCEDVEGVADGG